MIWVFLIDCRQVFDVMSAYVAFCHWQEVNWSCIDMEDLFHRYQCCTCDVIGLANNCVQERSRMWTVGSSLMNVGSINLSSFQRILPAVQS